MQLIGPRQVEERDLAELWEWRLMLDGGTVGGLAGGTSHDASLVSGARLDISRGISLTESGLDLDLRDAASAGVKRTYICVAWDPLSYIQVPVRSQYLYGPGFTTCQQYMDTPYRHVRLLSFFTCWMNSVCHWSPSKVV